MCMICRILARCEGYPDPNTCWIWTGAARNSYGITRAWIEGQSRLIQVHRLTYAELIGPIPAGFSVLHRPICGSQKLCCNPAHLFTKALSVEVLPTGSVTETQSP